MSLWDDVLTHLEAEWRAAVPAIPSGEYGVSRVLRQSGEQLTAGQLPHVDFHDLVRTESPIGAEDGSSSYRQLDVGIGVLIDFWSCGLTQDAHREHVEAFADRVKADPTLGGFVAFAWLASVETREAEHAGRLERRAVIDLNAVLVE